MGHDVRAGGGGGEMSKPEDTRTARVEKTVTECAPALLAYFARRVDRPDDAADLLSETLLVLWRRAAAMPTVDAQVRPWMFGIARHVLLHHRRSVGRQRAVTDRLRSILEATPHAGFADPTEYDELHAALRTLDAIDREIIGLVHWEGLSLAEAARVVRLKEGTVRSRYHRARATLRRSLTPAEDNARTADVASSAR